MHKNKFENLIISLMERLDLLAKKIDDIDKKFECTMEEIHKSKIRLTKIETWGSVIAFLITSGLIYKILFR